MKSTLKPLIIMVVTIFLLAGAYFAYSYLSDTQIPSTEIVETSVKPAETDSLVSDGIETSNSTFAADDFTVYDADGNTVTLSSFAGKPIVLNFWASWCGPCKSEMPEFQEAFEKYGEDVEFVMVNLTINDSSDDADALIAKNGYTFPVYYDIDGDGAITYGIRSIPSSFFLDSEGNIVAKKVGVIDKDKLEENIKAIMD